MKPDQMMQCRWMQGACVVRDKLNEREDVYAVGSGWNEWVTAFYAVELTRSPRREASGEGVLVDRSFLIR